MKIIKNKIAQSVGVLLLLLLITACKEEENTANPSTPVAEVTTLNVDVILPADIRQQWQPSIDWALRNITAAQQKLTRRVSLNLRYHDEDTEDLDALTYRLTHPEAGDDTCHAIIGPYHSANAPDVLRYAGRERLPVIMPTCTSSELQRSNARNTYAWFLTESDITQCEIMLAGAGRMGEADVALIYSDDIYGRSFRDWFGYYATEQQVHLAGPGIKAFARGSSLKPFLDSVGDDCQKGQLVMCIALGNAADYATVTEQVRQWASDRNASGRSLQVSVILSDTALEDEVVQGNLCFNYGISPTASPNYGFPQSYEARFGTPVQIGFAQVYDALTMLAVGAAHQQVHGTDCTVAGRQVVYYEKPYNAVLTDHIRSVVASKEGTTCGWDDASLARAFSEVAAGRDIILTGASGSLTFDSETFTKVLGTSYMLWRIDEKAGGHEVVPVFHISTEGSSTQASTTMLWQMDKKWSMSFDDDDVNHHLPEVTDRWAVVVSPSTSWSNYRHQADAFAMYQTLRHHGYDDDHIVLIVEDNLADDSRNALPGEIFVERSSDPAAATDIFMNDNVRKNAVVDYHFSDLRPDDLADIMTGRSSDRLPQVIHPTSSSDVFFFWSGHGGNAEGPLWGNEDAQQYFGTKRIRNIAEQMGGSGADGSRLYRRMMFAIETCYSGRWGEALAGCPDVLVLTAANAQESSKADIHDRDLGVYLSNAFARTFRRQVENHHDITIYDLYRELFKTTCGSHVSIYNQQQYGSVYTEKMSEFLPE